VPRAGALRRRSRATAFRCAASVTTCNLIKAAKAAESKYAT
jgi:hypothetical protein